MGILKTLLKATFVMSVVGNQKISIHFTSGFGVGVGLKIEEYLKSEMKVTI
jgi:hypothetical protein